MRTLVIFVKAPVAGRVKSRLAKGVGAGRSAAIFRILTDQTISHACDGPWKTILAIDPPRAISGYPNLWPRGSPRIGQAKGDLGARLRSVFRACAQGPVAVIGADAPALRAAHIRKAFRMLRGHDAVFGPAEDGGFWLIALKRARAAPDFLAGVRWSGAHALKDSLASLSGTFRVAMLERLADLDEPADLERLGARALLRSPARIK